ncbi:MAG: aldo/keto reductase [Gammaproteobacteria bacterium]|nr:aldo/keto reductase [Gammaproteobacteria bacterium]
MKISRRRFTQAGLAALTLGPLCNAHAMATAKPRLHAAIPSSGELLPIVGIGTNRFGVGNSESARAPLRDVLRRFHALGGSVIDTAPMYGSSESVLGDLIADLGIRDDLFIATKTDRDDGSAATEEQMRASMEKLHTDTIDLMQVHNLRGWQDALPVMREWQQEGRIRYIGITTSRSSQYEAFEKVMRSEELDFIQVNYSLEQREAAERLLPLAADRGMAVMINRAFGGGRIFRAVGDKPLPEWARKFGCASWAQFLLKYAIGHPAATLSIPGMTKLRHVDDNFGAAEGRLPNADERKRQEAFFDSL